MNNSRLDPADVTGRLRQLSIDENQHPTSRALADGLLLVLDRLDAVEAAAGRPRRRPGLND